MKNHRQQNILFIIIIIILFGAPSFFAWIDMPAPTIPQVIEQAKQSSLADASKNELALYRQGKKLTGFGDDR